MTTTRDPTAGPRTCSRATRPGDLASGWTQVAKLTADDGAADDEFGYSVSIDGNTVVIGAIRDDDKGSNSGSAHVFQLALPSPCAQVSTPPRNGTDNDCVAPLAHGDTCTPVCDDGFTAVTASAGCVNGNFIPGECRCSSRVSQVLSRQLDVHHREENGRARRALRREYDIINTSVTRSFIESK